MEELIGEFAVAPPVVADAIDQSSATGEKEKERKSWINLVEIKHKQIQITNYNLLFDSVEVLVGVATGAGPARDPLR